VEKGAKEEIGAPIRRRLDLRELIDGLKSRYYAMEEAMADLAPSQADRIVSWWIGKLGTMTRGIGSLGLEQFKLEVGLTGGIIDEERRIRDLEE
jgi:hypothetical protein